jgi:hypothetical protein
MRSIDDSELAMFDFDAVSGLDTPTPDDVRFGLVLDIEAKVRIGLSLSGA